MPAEALVLLTRIDVVLCTSVRLHLIGGLGAVQFVVLTQHTLQRARTHVPGIDRLYDKPKTDFKLKVMIIHV